MRKTRSGSTVQSDTLTAVKSATISKTFRLPVDLSNYLDAVAEGRGATATSTLTSILKSHRAGVQEHSELVDLKREVATLSEKVADQTDLISTLASSLVKAINLQSQGLQEFTSSLDEFSELMSATHESGIPDSEIPTVGGEALPFVQMERG